MHRSRVRLTATQQTAGSHRGSCTREQCITRDHETTAADQAAAAAAEASCRST
jgi:hypothetical protein